MSEKRYLPGNGGFRVGDRVRYDRERHVRSYLPYTGNRDGEVVEIPDGAIGTVVHDYGWDARYVVLFDDGTLTRTGGHFYDLVATLLTPATDQPPNPPSKERLDRLRNRIQYSVEESDGDA